MQTISDGLTGRFQHSAVKKHSFFDAGHHGAGNYFAWSGNIEVVEFRPVLAADKKNIFETICSDK